MVEIVIKQLLLTTAYTFTFLIFLHRLKGRESSDFMGDPIVAVFQLRPGFQTVLIFLQPYEYPLTQNPEHNASRPTASKKESSDI